MLVSYSEPGSDEDTGRGAGAAVSEPPADTRVARELIAQLLPGVNAERLVRALMSEREGVSARDEQPRHDSEAELLGRELARVRAQFALGDASRDIQHAFNNPLTALFAEIQLLELELTSDEHRPAVDRMASLARRLVMLSRSLSLDGGFAG